jgi:fluoride exporter
MEDWVQTLVQWKASASNTFQTLAAAGALLYPAVKKLLLVMCGGGLGAASRYLVGLMAAKAWGPHFPWGTLIVNLVGCFLIGFLFSLADRVRFLTPDIRLLFITGYLGAMTTFSTFALETVNAGRSGLTLLPLVNIVMNNVGGLTLTFIGMWLGRMK